MDPMGKLGEATVDGSEIRRLHQLRLLVNIPLHEFIHPRHLAIRSTIAPHHLSTVVATHQSTAVALGRLFL